MYNYKGKQVKFVEKELFSISLTYWWIAIASFQQECRIIRKLITF